MQINRILTKTFLICLIYCLSILPASAQTSVLFSTDNQISSSLINDIYQDQKGFIWIATEYGLNLFDGNKFVTFHHIENDSTLKSATTRLYDTEAKIICIVSKKGAQCIECHHKDI